MVVGIVTPTWPPPTAEPPARAPSRCNLYFAFFSRLGIAGPTIRRGCGGGVGGRGVPLGCIDPCLFQHLAARGRRRAGC